MAVGPLTASLCCHAHPSLSHLALPFTGFLAPCRQVPEELLAQANAPYTVVESADQVNPLTVKPPKGNATEELVSQLSNSSG